MQNVSLGPSNTVSPRPRTGVPEPESRFLGFHCVRARSRSLASAAAFDRFVRLRTVPERGSSSGVSPGTPRLLRPPSRRGRGTCREHDIDILVRWSPAFGPRGRPVGGGSSDGDEVLGAGGLRLIRGGQHCPPFGGRFGFAPEFVKLDDPCQGLTLLFLRRVGMIP